MEGAGEAVNGTWQTTGGGSGPGIRLVAAAAAAVAVVSYLATILLILAIIAAVLLIVLVAVVLLLRRHLNNPADAAAIAQQAAALNADVAAHAPRPAVTVVNNYYLLPGVTPKGAGWPVLPLRDAVTEIRRNER